MRYLPAVRRLAAQVTELVWPGGVGASNQLMVRGTPAVAEDRTVVVGTQTLMPPGSPFGTQAFLLAMNGNSGKVLWKVRRRTAAYEGVLTRPSSASQIGLRADGHRRTTLRANARSVPRLQHARRA